MKYYIADAFTDTIFKGNPAGVCLPEVELDAGIMQNIAAENNLPETAFVVKNEGSYNLRWFTPKAEIDLCGHGTLGSAFIIMNFVDAETNEIRFNTRSGVLTVKRTGELYELDFPARKTRPAAVTAEMERAVGSAVLEAHMTNTDKDLIIVLESELQVKNAAVDLDRIRSLASHAVTITASGDGPDFVSRNFAPNLGIPEDPVTGSSHTGLIPFWAKRLNKEKMVAMQLSKRGGTLFCEDCGDRVKIAGNAALYLRGEI